jgi:hypothetical protein
MSPRPYLPPQQRGRSLSLLNWGANCTPLMRRLRGRQRRRAENRGAFCHLCAVSSSGCQLARCWSRRLVLSTGDSFSHSGGALLCMRATKMHRCGRSATVATVRAGRNRKPGRAEAAQRGLEPAGPIGIRAVPRHLRRARRSSTLVRARPTECSRLPGKGRTPA